MQATELQFFLDYDAWATERLLATAETLSAGDFTGEPAPGHAAIRSTMLHSITGMRSWRVWLQGVPLERIVEDHYPTVAAVRALWQEEHAQLKAYSSGRSEAELDEVLEQRRPDRFLRAARWQFVVHAVNHDMQHRSELAQALTLLGHSPGELGITAYLQQLHAAEQPAR